MGLGVLCFTAGNPTQMAPLIEVYKNAVADADPVGGFVNDNVAIVSQFLCLPDGDEARDWVTRGGTAYHNSLLFRYLDTFPRPKGIPPWPEILPEPTRAEIDKRIEANVSVVGNPDECIEALQKFETVGCDQILMGPSSTTWPHEVMAGGGRAVRHRGHPRVRPRPRALHQPLPPGRRREAGARGLAADAASSAEPLARAARMA